MLSESCKDKKEDLSPSEMKQMLEYMPNLVFKLRKKRNKGFVITFVEGQLARELGILTDLAFGKTMADLFPVDSADLWHNSLQRAQAGEWIKLEIEISGRILDFTLQPILNGSKQAHEVICTAIDITAQKQAEEKMRHRALYDPLTSLPNRTLFQERLATALSLSHRGKDGVAVLYLDLARFKLINGMFGYQFGDVILKSFTDRMKECVTEGATIAYMGSDDFSIFLPHIKEKHEVMKVAEKIVHAMKTPFILEGREVFMDIHIGICLYPFGGKDVETLLKNAENAMHQAKDHPVHKIQFFTPDIHEQACEQFLLQEDLRKALEGEEFMIHFQPRVNSNTEQVVSAEVLLRWKHTQKGWISPAEFIPVAEESGLILKVGEWVLLHACKQNKAWQEQGYPPLRIAVNISVKQIGQPDFVEMIRGILDQTGLEAKWLELEITESCLVEDVEVMIEKLKALKSMGLKISIDDFGTGYSSLSYLKCFPVDFLKIDRSFITNISSDRADKAITSSIISLANNLELDVVAEGVETEDQMNILSELGCDEVQGFLFSLPLPAEEFAGKWLKRP